MPIIRPSNPNQPNNKHCPSLPLWICHASWGLILLELGIDSLLLEQTFLLFLHQSAARTAPRCQAVLNGAALDAQAVTCVNALDRLVEALPATAHVETTPCGTVYVDVKQVWVADALHAGLGAAEEETWAAPAHQTKLWGGEAAEEGVGPCGTVGVDRCWLDTEGLLLQVGLQVLVQRAVEIHLELVNGAAHLLAGLLLLGWLLLVLSLHLAFGLHGGHCRWRCVLGEG